MSACFGNVREKSPEWHLSVVSESRRNDVALNLSCDRACAEKWNDQKEQRKYPVSGGGMIAGRNCDLRR